MRLLLALAALVAIATAFQCSPDTILRMATDKRLKQLERECHLAKINEPECETRGDVENTWKEFTKLSDQYRQAVTQCRKVATGSKRRYRRTHHNNHNIRYEKESVGTMTRPESEQFDAPHPIRTKRQSCKTKSSQDLSQLGEEFRTHCERDNICLPDEDLPAGPQRDRFKELHSSRAKKYTAYLTQLSLCYGRL